MKVRIRWTRFSSLFWRLCERANDTRKKNGQHVMSKKRPKHFWKFQHNWNSRKRQNCMEFVKVLESINNIKYSFDDFALLKTKTKKKNEGKKTHTHIKPWNYSSVITEWSWTKKKKESRKQKDKMSTITHFTLILPQIEFVSDVWRTMRDLDRWNVFFPL